MTATNPHIAFAADPRKPPPRATTTAAARRVAPIGRCAISG
jgi:hypothetical protein